MLWGAAFMFAATVGVAAGAGGATAEMKPCGVGIIPGGGGTTVVAAELPALTRESRPTEGAAFERL